MFLTNQPTFPALTIAALNKSRWQVELSLKWIQQHLRIKRVTTQIWCAVATIVKQELR